MIGTPNKLNAATVLRDTTSAIIPREALVAHLRRMLEVNQPRLTEKEKKVAHYLLMGDTEQETAERLNLSIKTIKHHGYRIRKKFGVLSRPQLAAVIFGLR